MEYIVEVPIHVIKICVSKIRLTGVPKRVNVEGIMLYTGRYDSFI